MYRSICLSNDDFLYFLNLLLSTELENIGEKPVTHGTRIPETIVQKIKLVTGTRSKLIRDSLTWLDIFFVIVVPLLCSDLSKVVNYKSWCCNFVLKFQFFGRQCISCLLAIISSKRSDLSSSDMPDIKLPKIWHFLCTILRILQHPKVVIFLSVITIFFLLNR